MIALAHLCSAEMAEGTSLWMLYLGLMVLCMYLFVTRIVWNNSVGVSIRKLTNEQVANEMERAKIFLLANYFFTERAMNCMKIFPNSKRFFD